MVNITIQDGQYECEGIISHTKYNSFYPEMEDTVEYKLKSLPLRKNTLSINDYALKPISVSVNSQPKLIIEAYQKGKRVWSTHPMSIITLASSKLDGRHEYLFALEKHYSSLDKEISLRPYVYDIDDKGLFAKWRGSALAWPLLDAVLSPYDGKMLCALHRCDSFIRPDSTSTNKRVAVYQWNGFGFKGIVDSIVCESCRKLLTE
jgi:poly-gamma-glutamate synthesis protein (capsule biosynthesis protein)